MSSNYRIFNKIFGYIKNIYYLCIEPINKNMKYFNSFKQKDGSYVTQEWTADEMFNFAVVKYAIIGVLISFVSIIASGICLFVRLWDYEENERQPNFVGIFTALYFLIDYWRGWFITWFMGILGYGANMKIMAVCNLSLLVTHILLLIFGDTIYIDHVGTDAEKKSQLILVVIGTLIGSFFLSLLIF